jgi:microcystin-dependent protein
MDFEVRFRVREAKTHLEYYGYAVWNEQTVDSNGLPGDFDVDRYHFQWKVTTDAAGNNYAHESGEKVRGHKTVHVADDNKTQTLEVTGASGGTFKLGVGSAETGDIAWNATAAQVKTALSGVGGLTAGAITAGGGPLGTSPVTLDFTGDDPTPRLVITDDDLTGSNPNITSQRKDKYRVDFGRMWQPKRLYVSARLRVRAGAGCWSDWSLWTTPVHPTDGTTDPTPPFPANTVITFDHLHSARSDPLRAIVRGDYVSFWDVPGGDVEDDVARYIVQLQYSNDGGATFEWPPKRSIVRDKDDNDNRWRAVFHNIDRRRVYRYRVCTEDRYNRRGDWGPGAFSSDNRVAGWSAYVDPKTFDESPPAPTFASADVDRAKVTCEIDDPPAFWKPRIDYYEWEVYYDAVTAPNLRKKDRFHRGLHKVFTLNKPAGHSVIVRVRAYTASDEVSAWGTFTGTTATPPLPTIGTVSFDVQGPRQARYRAIVPVTVDDSGHDDNVKSIAVQFCNKLTNVTPTAGDKKRKHLVRVNDAPDEAVFVSIPKGQYCFARAKSIDGDDKESAWTSWTALGRARDSSATTTPGSVSGLVVSTPAPRRVTAKWDEPDDDEVTRWQVIVKRGAVTMETALVRNNRHVYRVPKADVGASHTMEVAAINDLGVAGALTSPGAGTPDDEDLTNAGWDVGDIKKRGHNVVPAKWLNTNGQSLTTAAYPELFAVIGYTYGGSGGNFNLPDLNGRHAIGASSVYSLGSNDAQIEANRSMAHLHGTDSTSTTPSSDSASSYPGYEATDVDTPTGDASGTPSNAADNENNDHNHASSYTTVPRGTAGSDAAGPAHQHGGKDNNHQHGHTHGSHGHSHGHGQHNHNHGHTGGHGHGHNHAGHGHGHGHDNKVRPHLAVRFIIKALP